MTLNQFTITEDLHDEIDVDARCTLLDAVYHKNIQYIEQTLSCKFYGVYISKYICETLYYFAISSVAVCKSDNIILPFLFII